MKPLFLAAVFASFATLAHAQTVIVGDGSTFTPGAGDIYNLPGYSSGYDGGRDFTNNYPAPGQTFTTLATAPLYDLTAVTLQNQGAGNGFQSAGSVITLGIYAVTGSTLTYAGGGNFTFNGVAPATGDYFTLNLPVPVLLAANTQYAFTFNGGAGYLGLDGGYPNHGPYAGGTAITVTFNGGSPLLGGTITTPTQTPYDRNFDIALSVAPEPSTWALLFGSAAVLAAVMRFRRSAL